MSKKGIGAKITIIIPAGEETIIEEELKRIYAKMPLWKKIVLIPFALLFLFSRMMVMKIFESEMETEKK